MRDEKIALVDYVSEQVKEMILDNIVTKFECHIHYNQNEYFERFAKMVGIKKNKNESYQNYMKRLVNKLILNSNMQDLKRSKKIRGRK
jgi:hypothetical protein